MLCLWYTAREQAHNFGNVGYCLDDEYFGEGGYDVDKHVSEVDDDCDSDIVCRRR